jgi:hypothetical protein
MFLETVDPIDALTKQDGSSVDYFVECKSCRKKIMIDKDAPDENTVTITGGFSAFPSCPHCGADHPYGPSDIQTQAQE